MRHGMISHFDVKRDVPLRRQEACTSTEDRLHSIAYFKLLRLCDGHKSHTIVQPTRVEAVGKVLSTFVSTKYRAGSGAAASYIWLDVPVMA